MHWSNALCSVTRRRGQGEGAVYRTADGRWRASVDLGSANGKRRRRYISGRTREEVARKLRQAQQTVDAGLPLVEGRSPSLREWLRAYLAIADARLRPRTVDGYRSVIERRIIPEIGDVRLSRLQPHDLDRLYAAMRADNLAPATVLKAHRIMSRALKVAWQRNLVARNVAHLVDAPSLVRTEIQPFTPAEARQLIDSAHGLRGSARWSVALALGLRQGEALGLAWDAIDLDRGTLTVRQALQRLSWRHGCQDPTVCGTSLKPAVRARCCPQRSGGGLRLVEPKSSAGRRTIALPPQLVDALRSHHAEQAAERLRRGSGWIDSGLVFTTETGAATDPSDDHAAWKSLLRSAGLRDARLHDARHTAATLMLTMGVPARVAMQVLGHSQISLTLGTYSHVVPELAVDAATRVGNALWA